MRMPLLDETRSGFADNNLFLMALLGLVSWARRLEAVLPAPPPTPVPGTCPPPPSVAGDDVLYLLLGIVSARGTFMSAMASAKTPAEAAAGAEAPAVPTAQDLDGRSLLLRDLLR